MYNGPESRTGSDKTLQAVRRSVFCRSVFRGGDPGWDCLPEDCHAVGFDGYVRIRYLCSVDKRHRTMKKHKITEQDYLKAHRKAGREEEIARHGRPVGLHAVHKSKKAYDRKREKAGLRNLPFPFYLFAEYAGPLTTAPAGFRAFFPVQAVR